MSAPQLVVLSSIDWSAAWQRHQIFAAQFAAAGWEVFFVENTGFRNPTRADLSRLAQRARRIAAPRSPAGTNPVPAGVKVFAPLALPPTQPALRAVNSAWLLPRLARQLRRAGLRPGALALVYVPTSSTLELLDRLQPAKIVYDCASNFRGHPQAPADLPELERELLERSALVVADSDFLYRQKKAEHPNVVQIHQGVDERFFAARPPSPEFKRFCYYGTWVPDLDPAFLTALADAGFEVTISGFLKAPLPEHPAIRVLPPAERDRLVERLQDFDVFLLPHRINEFMLGVVPAKIYECLAMGRPVLAAPLPSLEPFRRLLRVGGSPAEWVAAAKALPLEETEELRRERIATAREHTHAREFQRLLEAVGAARPAAPLGPARARRRATLAGYARGFGALGALYAAARALALCGQVLAGRLLGPLEYGRANLVLAVAAILQVAPMLGFPIAMGKFPAEEQEPSARHRLIATTLTAFTLWSAAAAAGIVLARGPLARLLRCPPALFPWAVALALATAAHTVLASPLLGLKRFSSRGKAEALYGACVPAALLLLVALGDRSFSAMIAALIISLLCAAAYAAWSLRDHLRPCLDRASLARVGGYAGLAAGNFVVSACVVAPARLVLNHLFTPREVGVFSAYFTSSVQLSLAALTVTTAVLVPLASEPQSQRDSWGLFKKIRLPLTAAVFAGFCLSCAGGLSLFGRAYPLNLSWVAAFAAAAALILLHGATGALHAARDLDGLRISVTGGAIAAAGNVALALALIPKHGIAGAALALVGGYAGGLLYYAVMTPQSP